MHAAIHKHSNVYTLPSAQASEISPYMVADLKVLEPQIAMMEDRRRAKEILQRTQYMTCE
jgi:hypothetical protein